MSWEYGKRGMLDRWLNSEGYGQLGNMSMRYLDPLNWLDGV